ncbi:gem (nuclear organelle) associated protein 2 [Gaertneriomyces sp. JEL0708]|nr:gem (nuclear organelle) associated protein 2 [Gaertneriomyces sp. JEL0708]
MHRYIQSSGGRHWTQADEDSIRRPALPLEGYDDEEEPETTPGAPPASGLQYLRMVRQEAQACEQIAVAKISPSQLVQSNPANVPDIRKIYFSNDLSRNPDIPDAIRPRRDWLESFIAHFELMKVQMEKFCKYLPQSTSTNTRTPHLNDEIAWKSWCYGKRNNNAPKLTANTGGDVMDVDTPDSGTVSVKEIAENTAEDVPLLSRVSLLHQGQVIRLLEYHCTWLGDTSISQEQAEWLFALFLRLDKLLTGEEISVIRTLCRKCQTIRAAMVQAAAGDPRAAGLNMIIAVISSVFGQRDLR